MKFKSHVFAQASGSVAGITYSHNKGGMYTRSRSIPINPATAPQQIARNALKTLTSRWSSVLTSAERASWAVYAANVPILNKLGEPRPIPPLSMYLRCNSPRLQFGSTADIIDTGPTIYSLATFTLPFLNKLLLTWSLSFTNTDDWAITTGGALNIYISSPQNQTVNFFKGPFLQSNQVAGNTTTPPTSPFAWTPPVPIVVGVRYFVRYQATNSDGRLSSPLFATIDT